MGVVRALVAAGAQIEARDSVRRHLRNAAAAAAALVLGITMSMPRVNGFDATAVVDRIRPADSMAQGCVRYHWFGSI